jgi:hypothetical protein
MRIPALNPVSYPGTYIVVVGTWFLALPVVAFIVARCVILRLPFDLTDLAWASLSGLAGLAPLHVNVSETLAPPETTEQGHGRTHHVEDRHRHPPAG